MDHPTVVLIDGTNVLHSHAWKKKDQRQGFINLAAGWAAINGMNIFLVFDGFAEPNRKVGSVEVVASFDLQADDVLAIEANRLQEKQIAHWLVSDDRVVQNTAGSHAQRVLSTQDFVAMIMQQEVLDKVPFLDATTKIVDTLSLKIQSKLEQIRRGIR